MRRMHGGKERVLTRGDLADVKPFGSWSKACREKSAEGIVAGAVTGEGPNPTECHPGDTKSYGAEN